MQHAWTHKVHLNGPNVHFGYCATVFRSVFHCANDLTQVKKAKWLNSVSTRRLHMQSGRRSKESQKYDSVSIQLT